MSWTVLLAVPVRDIRRKVEWYQRNLGQAELRDFPAEPRAPAHSEEVM